MVAAIAAHPASRRASPNRDRCCSTGLLHAASKSSFAPIQSKCHAHTQTAQAAPWTPPGIRTTNPAPCLGVKGWWTMRSAVTAGSAYVRAPLLVPSKSPARMQNIVRERQQKYIPVAPLALRYAQAAYGVVPVICNFAGNLPDVEACARVRRHGLSWLAGAARSDHDSG